MGRTKKILVVDDDPLFAEGVTAVLRMEGYEVECCYGGRECVEKVVEFNPQAVVCDHVMGDLTGLEVLRTLREDDRCREVPFIVITGFKSRSLQKDFEEAGAHVILSKSETSGRLIEIVGELFAEGGEM